MVNTDEANLKSSVFFIWGALCTAAFIYAYFLVPETKVRSLEIDCIVKQLLTCTLGSISRTGRQDDGGDYTTDFSQVEATHHLRDRYGHERRWQDGFEYRGCRAQGLHLLSKSCIACCDGCQVYITRQSLPNGHTNILHACCPPALNRGLVTVALIASSIPYKVNASSIVSFMSYFSLCGIRSTLYLCIQHVHSQRSFSFSPYITMSSVLHHLPEP